MRLPYSLRLSIPHRHPTVYARAMDWIELQGKDMIAIQANSGISYINGVTYVTGIEFRNDEDRTAFVLTFPELV